MDIPAMFLTFVENQFFSIENDIRCGFFMDGFDDIEVCTLYPYTLKSFDQEGMLYFVKCFFQHLLRVSYGSWSFFY